MFKKHHIYLLCLIMIFSLWGCGKPGLHSGKSAKIASSMREGPANSSISEFTPGISSGNNSSDNSSVPSAAAASSGLTDSSKRSDSESKEKTESDGKTESSEKTGSGNKTESSEKNGSDSRTESSPETAPAETRNPAVEKKVIFDGEDIVISSVDLKCPYNDDMTLSVNIENKKEHSVRVTCMAALLNDTLCISSSDNIAVWPGKEEVLNIKFDKEYYHAYGIEPIGDIKLQFMVDNDDYDIFFTTDYIDIPTSLHDEMNTEVDTKGFVDLYSADGIDISGTFVDSYGEYEACGVLMCVKNQTGRDITLDCREAAANDTMLSYGLVYNDVVLAGTSAIVFLAAHDSVVDEAGIKKSNITKFEFRLTIMDFSNYDRLAVTDPITLIKR